MKDTENADGRVNQINSKEAENVLKRRKISLLGEQESWREWCEKDKPYYVFGLENTGCIRVTDEKTYAIFKLAVQIYSQDYTADVEDSESYKYYEGEQNLQFYAIDMNTGEIIERREYAEEGQREYTEEYEKRIIQKFVEENR